MKLTVKFTTLLAGVPVALLGLAAQAQEQAFTYNEHVAKILNENCVICHREGGAGPMQLTNYEQVRPWAPLVQYKVERREMPPYAYDHGIGIQNLQGDWRLTQEEIDTVVAWVDQGSPLGPVDVIPPPADLPDTNEWSFAEQLGEPSMIVTSVPMDIPADGADLWSKHYVESGLTQDRCIKAAQVKPRGDARAVVHHANTDILVPGEDGDYVQYGFLTEYAMGKWGELMPEGVCRTLPKDARIHWDIHMYPGGVGPTAEGKAIEDNVVELAIWFQDEDFIARTEPYKQDLRPYLMREGYQNNFLVIPPNGYTMTQGFHSFDHPVRIDSYQPHGHLRMNAASLEIYYPATGQTEQISQVSNWSATWHHSHIYSPDEAPLLPAGAVLVVKQWYDNTADNPNNPDPDQWVFEGSRTGDEMSHAWIAVTHLDEAGYEKLVAERKEKADRTIAGNN